MDNLPGPYVPLIVAYSGATVFTARKYGEKEWPSTVLYLLSVVLYSVKRSNHKPHVWSDTVLYLAIAASYAWAAVVH